MIWSTRIAWQIWWPNVLAVLVGIAAWTLFVGQQQMRNLESAMETNLQITADRLSSGWDAQSGPTLEERISQFLTDSSRWLPHDTWVSVVDAQGVVLRESVPTHLSHGLGTTSNVHRRPTAGRSTVRIPSEQGALTFWVLTRQLSPGAESPMWIRVAVPADRWLNLAHNFRRGLWWSGTALGLILAVTWWGLLERNLQPVEPLARAAAKTARGEVTAAPPIVATNELQTIARALHELQSRMSRDALELQASGIRQETVLSAMVDGVLAVDRDKTILFVNSAVLQLLDLPAIPAVGRPLLESVRVHGIHHLISQALASGTSHHEEIHIDSAVSRTLSLHVTCMRGTPIPGAVVVLHDITDVRRLERLRQDFVANVSHELKTPLSSIKAYAETLRSGAIHDEANCLKFLGRIEEHADRLDALIADLLRLARIESGDKSFEIRPVHVGTMVHQRAADHQASAQSKRIELSVGSGDPHLHVRADDEGLRQILDNLIDNAIKYTGDAGKVTLRWFRVDGMVSIEVEDTGIGISEEDQKRVFERFYRVDKARSRELGGTGLGLAIVKHLAQFFGGQVYVRSEVHAGSTFGVRLPLAQPREPAPP